MIGRLWRRYFWLRFLVMGRRRHNRLVIERIRGRPILVLPEVFNPALFWTSELMLSAMQAEEIGKRTQVLDLGTGSGVCAVFAALRSGRVLATDINPAASRCARINALLNGVENRLEVREGDLFEPVGGKTFDLILFNPPYLTGEPEHALDAAFFSPDILKRFFHSVSAHLNPGGAVLLALSSHADPGAYHQAVTQGIFTADTVTERRLPGERLYIERLTLGPAHKTHTAAGPVFSLDSHARS